MTLEHDSKSEENCNLRSTKAGHSSNICLSSPNASVLHKFHRNGPRQVEMAALLNWEVMRPHAKPENVQPQLSEPDLKLKLHAICAQKPDCIFLLMPSLVLAAYQTCSCRVLTPSSSCSLNLPD